MTTFLDLDRISIPPLHAVTDDLAPTAVTEIDSREIDELRRIEG